MQIVKYETEDEAQQIIAEKAAQGLILVQVQNISDGNFLGFMEPSEMPEPHTEKSTALQELAKLKAAGRPKSISEIGKHIELIEKVLGVE